MSGVTKGLSQDGKLK